MVYIILMICKILTFLHVIAVTLRLIPFTFDAHMYLIWINQFLFYRFFVQLTIFTFTLFYWNDDLFLIISSSYICITDLLSIFPELMDLVTQKNTDKQSEIKLISCNLLNVHTNPLPITKEIICIDADILLLQEFSYIWDQTFNEFNIYPNKYPYSIKRVRKDGFGIAIFSKYELINPEIFEIDGFPYCKAIVKIKEKLLIQMYNVHIPPPRISNDGPYIKYFNSHQSKIFELIKNENCVDIGLLIVGDFNTTQYNYWIKQYKKIDMKCIFEICGKRYLNSFPNGYFMLPPIRLDHCFVNKILKNYVCDVITGVGYGSDHKPIVLKLVI
eukprot:328269_1